MHSRNVRTAKIAVPIEKEFPTRYVAAVECSTPTLFAPFRFQVMDSQYPLSRTLAMTKVMSKAIHTQIDQVRSPRDPILFSTDAEGHFKSVNAAGARLTGYSREELQTMDVFDLLPNTCKPKVLNCARQALRRRFGTVFEIAITTRSGRLVTLETSLAVVRQPDCALEFRGVAVELRDLRQLPRCLDRELRPRDALRRCVLAQDWVSVRTNRRVANTPETLDHSDLSFLRRE
jgi:PAS domain S-box-containing protein